MLVVMQQEASEAQIQRVIDRLTEGEARWLHREFCEVYKGVLARPSSPAVATPESLWDRELDA